MIEAASVCGSALAANGRTIQDGTASNGLSDPGDRSFLKSMEQSVQRQAPLLCKTDRTAHKDTKDQNSKKTVAGPDQDASQSSPAVSPNVPEAQPPQTPQTGAISVPVAAPAPPADSGANERMARPHSVELDTGKSKPCKTPLYGGSIKFFDPESAASVGNTPTSNGGAAFGLAAVVGKIPDAVPAAPLGATSPTAMIGIAPHVLQAPTDKEWGAVKPSHSAPATLHNVDPPGGRNDAQTLVATPNVLEIGIESANHGWLRVRAEMGSGGEVAASVVAATATAAASLHRELPALSAYLAIEDVAVSSLMVNAAVAASEPQSTASHEGHTSRETPLFAAAGGSQSGTDGRRRDQPVEYVTNPVRLSGSVESGEYSFDVSGRTVPPALFRHGSGSWLSIRV